MLLKDKDTRAAKPGLQPSNAPPPPRCVCGGGGGGGGDRGGGVVGLRRACVHGHRHWVFGYPRPCLLSPALTTPLIHVVCEMCYSVYKLL